MAPRIGRVSRRLRAAWWPSNGHHGATRATFDQRRSRDMRRRIRNTFYSRTRDLIAARDPSLNPHQLAQLARAALISGLAVATLSGDVALCLRTTPYDY